MQAQKMASRKLQIENSTKCGSAETVLFPPHGILYLPKLVLLVDNFGLTGAMLLAGIARQHD